MINWFKRLFEQPKLVYIYTQDIVWTDLDDRKEEIKYYIYEYKDGTNKVKTYQYDYCEAFNIAKRFEADVEKAVQTKAWKKKK